MAASDHAAAAVVAACGSSRAVSSACAHTAVLVSLLCSSLVSSPRGRPPEEPQPRLNTHSTAAVWLTARQICLAQACIPCVGFWAHEVGCMCLDAAPQARAQTKQQHGRPASLVFFLLVWWLVNGEAKLSSRGLDRLASSRNAHPARKLNQIRPCLLPSFCL